MKLDFLKKEYGGIPVFVWGGVVIGGILIGRIFLKGQSSPDAAITDTTGGMGFASYPSVDEVNRGRDTSYGSGGGSAPPIDSQVPQAIEIPTAPVILPFEQPVNMDPKQPVASGPPKAAASLHYSDLKIGDALPSVQGYTLSGGNYWKDGKAYKPGGVLAEARDKGLQIWKKPVSATNPAYIGQKPTTVKASSSPPPASKSTTTAKKPATTKKPAAKIPAAKPRAATTPASKSKTVAKPKPAVKAKAPVKPAPKPAAKSVAKVAAKAAARR